MAGFFNRFRRREKAEHRSVSGTYEGVRERLFGMDPADLGLRLEQGGNPVWALLMETAYEEAVVSLLATAEGTVSLYFSNGGGIIGLGQHAGPARIAGELIDAAPEYLTECEPTEDKSLPRVGMTRIYMLTFDKTFAVEQPDETLADGKHAMSPFYENAQELIAAVRDVHEQRQKQ